MLQALRLATVGRWRACPRRLPTSLRIPSNRLAGGLAEMELPVGFVWLDDGKCRPANDPLLTRISDRMMLGSVVTMDDAWSMSASCRSHFGQSSYALELLEGDFEVLLFPPIDIENWWGIRYDHYFEARRQRVPKLPQGLHRRVKAILNTTPPIDEALSAAISQDLLPLQRAGLNDKIIAVQKSRSRFGAMHRFSEPPHTAVRVSITDGEAALAVEYTSLPLRAVVPRVAIPEHAPWTSGAS